MAFYDNLYLEKGLYHQSAKNFTASLEALDPSMSYKGTELEGLDAYERQLKRFDIKVKGFNSDNVEKFFQSSQSATLFPEFVKRCVMQGVQSANVLSDIVASNTKINTLDYRPLASLTSEAAQSFPKVLEGGLIPTTEIKLQENLITLYKRGRMLVSSYEAIKFERLDLFAVTLKQIGAYIAKSQLEDALDVILNGDGNSNPAEVITVATAGKITYADLINLWGKFGPYEMNRLIVAPDVMQKLLAIPELQDPMAGLNFQGTGKLSTPLGATLYRANGLGAGKIIALDRNCALEMVTAADVQIENDKLIDRQLERSAITSIVGFAKIFADAAKVMTV